MALNSCFATGSSQRLLVDAVHRRVTQGDLKFIGSCFGGTLAGAGQHGFDLLGGRTVNYHGNMNTNVLPIETLEPGVHFTSQVGIAISVEGQNLLHARCFPSIKNKGSLWECAERITRHLHESPATTPPPLERAATTPSPLLTQFAMPTTTLPPLEITVTAATLVHPGDFVFAIKMPRRRFDGKFGLLGRRTWEGFQIARSVREGFLRTWELIMPVNGSNVAWLECQRNIEVGDLIIGCNSARLDVRQQDVTIRCQPLTNEMTAATMLYILILRPWLEVLDL